MRVLAVRHQEGTERRREEVADLEIRRTPVVRDVEDLFDEAETVPTGDEQSRKTAVEEFRAIRTDLNLAQLLPRRGVAIERITVAGHDRTHVRRDDGAVARQVVAQREAQIGPRSSIASVVDV